jgi:uncharacterized damage-inducible protein DinB
MALLRKLSAKLAAEATCLLTYRSKEKRHPDVAGFVGYLIAHDAHHRGQITMLARQSGHAIPQKAMFGMWEWGVR